jgi:signal transduction histidine kinase
MADSNSAGASSYEGCIPSGCRDPEAHLMRAMAPERVERIPLIVCGQGLGAMLFLVRTRPLTAGERELAAALADRTALAIHAARRLEQTRKAAQRSLDMVAAVAHELGNSLKAVELSALALSRQAGGDSKTGRRAELVLSCSRQALELARELMVAVRSPAHGFEVTLKPELPAPLLNEIANTFGGLVKDHDFSISAEPSLPPILVDRARLSQILTNLICNAVHFTPVGQRVSVRAELEMHAVRFSVIDAGAGIEPQELERIFEFGWRGARSRHPGAGLGLAICKELVEIHGGQIWAESRPGAGSSFHFTIPLAPTSSEKDRVDSRARPAVQGAVLPHPDVSLN